MSTDNSKESGVIVHGGITIDLNEDGSVRIIAEKYMVIQPQQGNSVIIFNTRNKLKPEKP